MGKYWAEVLSAQAKDSILPTCSCLSRLQSFVCMCYMFYPQRIHIPLEHLKI